MRTDTVRIMFVCHGNICRSPMAEVIFRDLVQKKGLQNLFSVSSCATSTEEIWNGIGNPIYPEAEAELRKHGLSANGHRAVLLTKKDYEKYDLFFGMDERNMRGMLRIFGSDPENKVRKLRREDVSDPWYYGHFDVVYDEIKEGCEAILEEYGK